MENIKDNVLSIRERIHEACIKANRPSSAVKLLLATKTLSPEIILHAFSLGERLIGENRAQELVEKYDALKIVDHQTHFIGHLQSNKIKSVIDKVSCIESVDSVSLAEKINARLVEQKLVMNVFVEVNTSGEISKHGCKPEALIDIVGKIAELPALHICGLMTIGALSDDTKKVRECFALLRNLSEKVNEQHFPGVCMQELSMGMSSDFELAIAEGATEVRIGSAIFGKRPAPTAAQK